MVSIAARRVTRLWVRGILEHEYGVDLRNAMWMTLQVRTTRNIRTARKRVDVLREIHRAGQ